MARFSGIDVGIDGFVIVLRFQLDQPRVVGWQICDPATGVFLQEGQWAHAASDINLRIPIPPQAGGYQVRVGPVEDRSCFISLDARVEAEKLKTTPPRVLNLAEIQRKRFVQSFQNAFSIPFQSIWRNRNLIVSMIKRDLLARYRGSVAGGLWTFLNPLLLMATYGFVFGVILHARLDTDTSPMGFVLYFLAGMLPWLAFAEAAGRAPHIILEYRSFVKKVVFPLETLPINLVVSGIFTELIGLAILIVLLMLTRGTIPTSIVWLPLLVIPQLLFTAGLCWMLAGAGVYLRDLGQITGYVLTLWFFLTPIGYPESQIPASVAWMFKINPMRFLVHGYRNVLLENRVPSLQNILLLWTGSLFIAIVGHAWFHRLRKTFADVI